MRNRIRPHEHVLVVCTGNICRSPFAEYELRSLAQARGLEVEARSAGTHAVPGQRVTEEALAVAAELGVDLSPHRAMPLTLPLIGWSTLILALTEEHARLLEPMCIPGAGKERTRIWTLDVADPYGASVDVYRACYRTLADRISRLL